jgi:hypothetical protein
MTPILKEGDAEVYELANGRPLLVDIATGKKTEFRNAEDCWAEIQKRKRERAAR